MSRKTLPISDKNIYFYKMPVVFGIVKGMGALCVRVWGTGRGQHRLFTGSGTRRYFCSTDWMRAVDLSIKGNVM